MATYYDQVRRSADRRVVRNEILLRGPPRGPARQAPYGSARPKAAGPAKARRPEPPLKPVGEALVNSADGFLSVAERKIPKDLHKAAPKVVAGARFMGALPGIALDVADVAMADTPQERERAAYGGVGGFLGGLAGAAVPFAEPVTVPAGAYAGKKIGEFVYDNKDEMAANAGEMIDSARAKAITLRDQLGRELARYAPYDLQDRIMRR